jgi:hypothetical protein
MASLSAAQLVALWESPSGAPAHQRLEPLIAAFAPDRTIERDTLGARNRRLLALHSALLGTVLEARLRCGRCRTENEFTIPSADILACPVPASSARVTVRSGGKRLVFRLPRMGDLAAAAAAGRDRLLPRIAARCQTGGDRGGPVPAAVLARLSARFEALDPAARIVVDLVCADCKTPLRASVDIAEFVATGIDRHVARLLREVHILARAYGWTEAEILALPPGRRQLYLSMIAEEGAAAQDEPVPRARRA